MKLINICFLLCLVVSTYAHAGSTGPDPQITVTSPIEGNEFASGATVNLNLSVTCDCEMDQVMLIMMNSETDKETILSEMTSFSANSLANHSQSITLPTVTEETDITFGIVVMDNDGEDMESEEITITVMP